MTLGVLQDLIGNTLPTLGFSVLLSVGLSGCKGSVASQDEANFTDTIRAEIVGTEVLRVSDTVVVPTLSDSTAWFQRPRSIHPSRRSDQLWAIEVRGGLLTEFSTAGTLVRVFDRQGQGPEELQSPKALHDSSLGLLVLDPPGRRIATFSREGRLNREVEVPANAADFAPAGADALIVVPGKDGLVDVYHKGRRTRSAGPKLPASVPCRTCKIAILPDGRVLVAEPKTPQLFLSTPDASRWKVIDLDNSLLSAWKKE